MTQQVERKVAEVVNGVLVIYFDYLPPPSLRGNSRAHWRVISKENNRLKDSTRERLLTLRTNTIPQFKKAHIVVTQYWCGRPLDDDNLAKGVKGCRDVLTEWGVYPDDSPLFITTEYRAERMARRDQRGFELRVEAA